MKISSVLTIVLFCWTTYSSQKSDTIRYCDLDVRTVYGQGVQFDGDGLGESYGEPQGICEKLGAIGDQTIRHCRALAQHLNYDCYQVTNWRSEITLFGDSVSFSDRLCWACLED